MFAPCSHDCRLFRQHDRWRCSRRARPGGGALGRRRGRRRRGGRRLRSRRRSPRSAPARPRARLASRSEMQGITLLPSLAPGRREGSPCRSRQHRGSASARRARSLQRRLSWHRRTGQAVSGRPSPGSEAPLGAGPRFCGAERGEHRLYGRDKGAHRCGCERTSRQGRSSLAPRPAVLGAHGRSRVWLHRISEEGSATEAYPCAG